MSIGACGLPSAVFLPGPRRTHDTALSIQDPRYTETSHTQHSTAQHGTAQSSTEQHRVHTIKCTNENCLVLSGMLLYRFSRATSPSCLPVAVGVQVFRTNLGSVNPNAFTVCTRGGRKGRRNATERGAARCQSTLRRITNPAKVNNFTCIRTFYTVT